MSRSKVVVALLVFLCAGLTFGADMQIVSPPGDKPGGKIPSDGDAEVHQALDNIGGVLKAAGLPGADVVSVQVYPNNPRKVQRMNAVYPSYFKNPRPTMTTVVVAGLVGPGSVEIAATARK
jgi:enamine deaminase RidA (YjgF/YER057c/UK114 family)